MKDYEVPQEDSVIFKGQKKALYATDAEGNYKIVPSTGWKVEETATLQAVNAIEKQAFQSLERYKAGLTSPLEFYMHKARMDLPTLAQCTGIFQWRIRRHFQPRIFKKLPPKLLKKYADALNTTSEQLLSLPTDD